MRSENNLIAANLERAGRFVEQAVQQGARLVLLPEFASTGYVWTEAIWQAGEGSNGPTARWLRDISRRFGIWLGTTFLEADRGDFFNTFVLTGPDGDEVGRVRKQFPALWEAFFFKGEAGPHVIDSELGRIGIGICYENYLAFLPRLVHRQSIDSMLMPHSAPSLAESFTFCGRTVSRFRADVFDVASFYARTLGVPAIMANKTGPWHNGFAFEQPANFLGGSAIADSDGRVLVRLADEERVIVAEVVLDPRRKVTAQRASCGRWAKPTSASQTLVCWITETLGALWYRTSRNRRRLALRIASSQSISEEIRRTAAGIKE